jgi:hypothetical protein
MKTLLLKTALCAAIATAAVAPAHAEFLKFYSGNASSTTLDNGVSMIAPNGMAPNCSGDYCGADDGSLNYTTSAGLLRVYGNNPGSSTDRVRQDVTPNFGGLGVDRDPADDAIGKGEVLKLQFAQQVTLLDLVFFSGNHDLSFDSDLSLSCRINGGSWLTTSLVHVFTNDLVGTTFEFRIDDASSDQLACGWSWFTCKCTNTDPSGVNGAYLGGVNLAAQVPAPGVLALLGIGALGFGAASRRRRG